MPPQTSDRLLEALDGLGRALRQDQGVDELLAEAARLAADASGADAAVVLERCPAAGALTLRAGHQWPASPSLRLNSASGHIGAALQSPGGRVLVADLGSYPDECPEIVATGFRSAAAIVIGDPERPFGLLILYSRKARTFAGSVPGFMNAVGAMVCLAVRRAQLGVELDRERDERVHVASLVEGAEDAIMSATLEGTILSWNPGAERLYGYPAHEIVGAHVSVLVPAEHEADRRYMMERVRAGERIPAFDAVHRRKGGAPITVSLSLSPVQDRRGEIVAVAGVAHDVTATRRLESEVRQSAKMEAVGRLAGGLAHDFNNMLTVIDGYSELALMKLPADHPVRGLVEEIHKAGEHAADLTRQLMVFSRKSMLEPQVVDLSDLIQVDVAMLSRVIGDDVTIEARLAPNLEHVMADRTQFDQVLINLVINARDAMPVGGTVIIETANVEFDTAHGQSPRQVPPGQYVMLAVTDSGVGMDSATKARMFEPFFTTKGSGRGTGLGLATVQTFVVQCGGHVTVDSEPGVGTTVRLYVPTVPLPVAAAQGSQSREAPPGSETVLVVEDEDAVRVFAEAVLQAAGYDVMSAANGAEALTLAGATTHPIHLLMSDVVMPVLGGHALAEQLRSLHPEARVLFTSGYTPEAVSRRGVAIPASTFIQKPYSPAALCRKIREILDR